MDLLDDWNSPEGVGAVEFGATSAAPGQDLFDVELVKDYISRGRGTPVAVALAGEHLVVATSRNWLIRLNLLEGGPEALSELDLQRNPESTRCQRLWVDPTATHTIALLGPKDPLAPGAEARSWSGELVYVASMWKKARSLSKLKNKPVSAVAFLEGVSDSANIANNVLLGTADGELMALDVRDPSREHVKMLINLTPEQPIFALRALHGPAGSSGFPPLFVLLLTRSHLHAYWGGKGSLEECISDIAPSCSLDLTQTVKGQSARIVLTKPLSVGEPSADPRAQIDQVTILCEAGILSVPIHLPDLRPNDTEASCVFSTPRFLPLEACSPAVALASTSFHYALLSPAALTLVNRVSNEVAQVIPLARLASPLAGDIGVREGLNLLSTSEDGSPVHTRVLLWSRDALLELDTSREDRDIWRAFLDAGDYAAAALHCRSAEQRSAVYLAHGEACIRTGAWLAAGELFGKVTAREPSFEDLALRFMDAGQPAALQRFLEVRLDILSSRRDQLQRTLVASWLLELMLDRRNQAALAVVDSDVEEEEQEQEQNGNGNTRLEATTTTEEGADLSGITAKLRTFLQTQTEVLDAGTTTELLVGYGQTELLEVYAFARGDFETVLELVLQRNDAKRALEVLRHPDVGSELVYKFAPALAALDADQSVEAWLRSSDPLDPSRLLPALLTLASTGGAAGRAAAKRYLSVVLDDAAALRLGLTQPVTDRALYDLMLDLLCTKQKKSTIEGASSDEEGTDDADKKGESALLRFLESARSPLGTPRYDAKLALRLARERGCHRASVQLYEDLGLPSEAVQAALEFDQGLAIQVAQRAGGDRGLKRRLWLDIAGHLIRRSEDPKDQAQGIALVKSLLENSRGVLHIEDVLPLFPEFTEIDAFKDVLCTALEAYNEEIEDLKREMSISTKTAHAIRGYLAGLETRVGVLGPDARCSRCDRPLGAPPPVSAGPSGGAVPKLYLFPTGNAFHGACLAAEVSAVAPRIQRQRIAAALAALASGRDVARYLTDLEADVAQTDPFWSESCLVQLVQKPYIPPNELEAELQSWAL